MSIGAKRFWLLLSLPATVLIIGTVGFVLLEDLSVFDAFYFTLVTISTVGYGDIHPTTIASKLFGIFLIVFGIGTFLTIITTATQILVQRGEDGRRRQRLNMLIGVFFTEVGNELLHLFTSFDPEIEEMRHDFTVSSEWSDVEFSTLKEKLGRYHHSIDPKLVDLETVQTFLRGNGDLLLRQLENTDLNEHEAFTELLWAIVHLRDEMLARHSLKNLPDSDLAHLANDIRRVYDLLTRSWLEYMQHLKSSYPYLFSLALRTNPFVVERTVIIEQ